MNIVTTIAVLIKKTGPNSLRIILVFTNLTLMGCFASFAYLGHRETTHFNMGRRTRKIVLYFIIIFIIVVCLQLGLSFYVNSMSRRLIFPTSN